MSPIISQSNNPAYDALLGREGLCGQAPSGSIRIVVDMVDVYLC